MQIRVKSICLIVVLILSAVFSIHSIHNLQRLAQLRNYAGAIRGSTQVLVKHEYHGEQDDELIERLDWIFDQILTSYDIKMLKQIDNGNGYEIFTQMQAMWGEIKSEIQKLRQGGDGETLYDLSEEYVVLSDQLVMISESYVNSQVTYAEVLLVLMCLLILFVYIILQRRSNRLEQQEKLRKAEDEKRAQQEQMRRMSDELRAPLDQISELIYMSDMDTYDMIFMNDAGRKTFGVDDLKGKKCYQLIQGLDAPCEFCTNKYLVPNENYNWEHDNLVTKRRYLLKDRIIQWEGKRTRIEIAFDITDATAEKQALAKRLDAEQLVVECVRTLYDEHDIGAAAMVVVERMGRYLEADRAHLGIVRDNCLDSFTEWHIDSVTDIEPGSPLLSLRWLEDCLEDFSEQGCIVIDDVAVMREKYPDEYKLMKKRGIVSTIVAPMHRNGKLYGLLGVNNYPLEQKRSVISFLQTLSYFTVMTYIRRDNEEQLTQMSYHDTLTSFYNRNRYTSDIESMANDGVGSVGVAYLDVNGLKDINDQKGHAYGDKILGHCACLIKEAFPDGRHYRIGGDEFVVICTQVDRMTYETNMANLKFKLSETEECSAAIGGSWQEDIRHIKRAILDADEMMYKDKKEFYRKRSKSNRYRHISDDVLHLSDPKVLQQEINKGRFLIYLQPKVSVTSRIAVGAEALVRYAPQPGTVIMPGSFLPLLEDNKTISQIDFYVFGQVCQQLRRWGQEGKKLLPVSVNFSRCSLSMPDFVGKLTEICNSYGVAKNYLEIELTETSKEAEYIDIKSLIEQSRQAGFLISIDDFGTEFANLSMLSAVEFDVLKLDKSIIDHVGTNPKANAVVEAVVEICNKLSTNVVAEGVETEKQLEELRNCGVETVQGFLFSKAVPMAEYEEKYL